MNKPSLTRNQEIILQNIKSLNQYPSFNSMPNEFFAEFNSRVNKIFDMVKQTVTIHERQPSVYNDALPDVRSKEFEELKKSCSNVGSLRDMIQVQNKLLKISEKLQQPK